jgi:hypothetical protein
MRMSAVLIPVGVPVGPIWRTEEDEPETAIFLAGILRYLPVQAFLVWSAAVACIPRAVEYLIEDLAREKLLVSTDQLSEEESLIGHRLVPTAVGLGNDCKRPSSFVIGDCTLTPIWTTDALTYMLWMSSASGEHLQNVCQAVAESVGMDSSHVRSHAVATIPALLSAHLAFLDRSL